MSLVKYPILGMLLCFFVAGCSKTRRDKDASKGEGEEYRINWEVAADSSLVFLLNNYWSDSLGYFNRSNKEEGFEYWPQAHGLDILVDAYARTKSPQLEDIMKEWYAGVYYKNGNSFFNDYYDDMGWNALALLRAYKAFGQPEYGETAKVIWEEIKEGWNDDEIGGVSWRKSQPLYRNTPTNGPACILAARLYREFGNPDDLEWAEKIYSWWKSSLYDASSGFVNDGVKKRDNDSEMNKDAYTYNQGLGIGAALEMYAVSKEEKYLRDAVAMANYVLDTRKFIDDKHVLKDEGGGDGGLFKGIFVRYFTQLILNSELNDEERERYVSFLQDNAETLWRKGTNKELGLFGSSWSSFPTGEEMDLTVEESGCMLMEAMALLEKEMLP